MLPGCTRDGPLGSYLDHNPSNEPHAYVASEYGKPMRHKAWGVKGGICLQKAPWSSPSAKKTPVPSGSWKCTPVLGRTSHEGGVALCCTPKQSRQLAPSYIHPKDAHTPKAHYWFVQVVPYVKGAASHGRQPHVASVSCSGHGVRLVVPADLQRRRARRLWHVTAEKKWVDGA